MKCSICHRDFEDMERVIYSTRETFVWKPADVPDTINAALATPYALRDSRKDHVRTVVANNFVDWGKANIPDGAFYFRHQACEPVRTGAGMGGHNVNKHAIRFSRAMPGRMNG